MYIIFCGDRNWNNWNVIKRVVDDLPLDAVVVNGGCRGADKMASYCAILRGLETRTEIADWFKYRDSAGPIRNRLMIEKYKPKFVFAFHDNIEKSKGTKDMINAALEHHISTKLFKSDGTIKWIYENIYNDLYCPNCGGQTVTTKRWETCQNCGCVFKLLNTPEQQERGY